MAKMRTAAAVALLRGSDRDLEVLLVERNPALRFFGGYWALPGGTVDAEDLAEESADAAPSIATLTRCAVREMQEEVQLELAAERLRPLCQITTPAFAPVRYPTQFFTVSLDDTERPRIVEGDGELIAARFWKPQQALAAWKKAELLIVPPVLFLLELLQDSTLDQFHHHAEAGTEALERGRLHPVRFSPGIFVAPLETPTRPPATTTNTFLVGEQRLFLIDPGTPHPQELDRLHEIISERLAAGASLRGIVLTHHHPDHIGGVVASAQRYSVPVWAHPETHARLHLQQPVDGRDLNDGDTLELGTAPDGEPGWKLEALHTPGHAVGHLAFRESRYGALIAGDLCSTLSTVMIDPPEGHLGTYLKSLTKLLERPLTTLYPSHGPAVRDSHAMLRYYLKHRQAREEKLFAALQQEPQNIDALLPVVYDDVDPRAWPMARRSLLAGLIKLNEDGRAREVEAGRWQRG